MTLNEEKTTTNSESQKEALDKNNLKIKFVALKKGLIDEKNKNRQLETENEKLDRKCKELEEELKKIKEENVTKQESINKLKEELQKYRDKNSSNKNITKFFSSLLDRQAPENIEEKDKKNEKIESLEQENIKLNQDLSKIKSQLEISEKKLKEATDNLKSYEDKKISSIEDIKANYNKKIDEINSSFKQKEESYKNTINEKEGKISEYLNIIKGKDIIIKSIESIRTDLENQVLTMKEKVRISEENLNKTKDEMKEMQKHNDLMNQDILNNKKEIDDLYLQIQQYKLIIEDLTPIKIDYVFKGTIISHNNSINNLKNKNLEISFAKYQQSIYMKIGEQELILLSTNIVEFMGNKFIPGQIKFVLRLNNKKKENTEIVGQFTKKEGEYIKQFYREFKNKIIHKEDQLINMSLNNFYY